MSCGDCIHAHPSIFEDRWVCDVDGKIVFDEGCPLMFEKQGMEKIK